VSLPSKGKIVVNVSDSRGSTVNRLDVFVDGEKTNCATAPCYLPYGQGTHEVKVVAEGYDVPAPQAVVVKSGDSTTVTFTVGSSGGSGIKVAGAQAGVKLYVDDKEIGPLPQIVRDLSPGDHSIRVAGSERYMPIDKHVIVERDKLEDLGTVTLKVLKGKVTVSLGTPGARVFIVSGSDRRELPMLPISVDIDTAKSWSLEGAKTGYEDYRQLISFDDGQAEKTYTVTLDPKGSGSPGTPAPYQPQPQYNPPQQQNSYQQPAPPAPTPHQAPQNNGGGGSADTSSGGGEAFLNINSIPPSTCILDGKSLGSTPRIHVSVKPGSHTVKFVDSDDGLTKTIFVNVGAGETKPAVAKLN
jgi:serine/threonine-protein kinase